MRKLEVTAGGMLAGNMQEIVAGINPGAQVVEMRWSCRTRWSNR